MAVQQTTNAPDKQNMVVWQSRLNQQMGKTNEDVAVMMWQPTMAPAKCRCDGTAIKKHTSQMRNGSTAMNKDGCKNKQRQLGN